MTNRQKPEQVLLPIVGERIKKTREKRGLTQERLAEVLSVDTLTVRRYELGQVLPPLSRLFEIAEKLDVGADYLLGFDQSKGVGNRGREETEFLTQYRLLDKSERGLVLQLMQKLNR